MSLNHDLPLPSLLVLDGLSNNVGNEGFDLARRDDTYRLLMEEVENYAGRLQVIALDNDVPAFATESIVVTLRPDARLVRRNDDSAADGSAGDDIEADSSAARTDRDRDGPTPAVE